MSSGSGIQWTEATWNPVVGCTRASRGCDSCYAVTMTHRLEAMGQSKYAGLTVLNGRGDRHFNGVVRTVPEALEIPLRWRKPRMIFVNSMSDLFHKDVPFDFIDRVFAVMALCPQHTFQVLTKRPERMSEYLNERRADGYFARDKWQMRADEIDVGAMAARNDVLDNVWMGTSCEDQAAADERIPHLLQCPAAVRFISAEPLLGEINLPKPLGPSRQVHLCLDIKGAIRNRSFHGFTDDDGRKLSPHEAEDALLQMLSEGHKLLPMGGCDDFDPENGCRGHKNPGISWVIAGGESGPGARPCNIDWIRSIVHQCQAAGVPAFVKQLGARPYCGDVVRAGCSVRVADEPLDLKDRKGGDITEFPDDLKVRQFPDSSRRAAEPAEVTA